MYIVMISRGFPTNSNPQWGCFEKDQAEALVEYGHKVVVISVDARFEKDRGKLGMHCFEHAGVSYYNYVMLPGIFFSKIVGSDYYRKHIKYHYFEKVFNKSVSEHGLPDIIYSQFFFNTIAGVQLKEKYGIPLVGIEHLARFNEDNLSPERENGASYAFKGVDALIAVSSSLAINLEKRYGVKCKVVHNMYGMEFDYGENPIKDDASKLPLVFVSAASLTYRKGFDVLIKAFAKTRLSNDLWKLIIIGWGEEIQNLKNLVREYGLQNNVIFLGKKGKQEIVAELRKSNVYVLPSRNENFSVAILEGLATGLPIIATDCGGIRECLDDKNGVIVPVDDVDAMANAIMKMVSHYSQYDRKYISEDCKSRFSPQAIAKKLTEVFEGVLQE